MTLITHDTRLSELDTTRAHIAATLKSIRLQIVDLKTRVEDGNLQNTREVGQLLADARYWLKAARETEAEIENVEKQRAGIVHDYGLDLEHARSEIGCRLARLRRCCHEE
ncbi:hypothetical protein [Puniceibacterium confluentis]|uniref:hypothetical protein n=1 Tax=Puniceibacterium confluentis TaxID=1958944 RepID=UPI0016456620|nr:hypothetical protein [Puniceibacterium confluentis]